MLEVNLRGVLPDPEADRSRLLAPRMGLDCPCRGEDVLPPLWPLAFGGPGLLLVLTESAGWCPGVAPRGLSLCVRCGPVRPWQEHLQGQGCLFQLGGEELLIESGTQVDRTYIHGLVFPQFAENGF